MSKKFIWIATLVVILALAVPWAAFADDVYNGLDNSVDVVAEVMPLTFPGTAAETSLTVLPTWKESGLVYDAKKECNLSASTPRKTLTVTIASSDSTVATVSPLEITFDACGVPTTLTVTPLKTGSTTVSVSWKADTAEGSFSYDGATFTVNVVPPPNTAPGISVKGVTPGASYEFGSVPDATCEVTDAEDGNSSFAATLTAVTGLLAAYGLGEQTASCSYTDGGGLTASASVTYGIVDITAPELTVPAADVVAEATSAAGAVVEYLVSATDAVDSAPTITCSQDSGTGFPLGTTEVSCSASDFTGNTSETQTFNVVVRDTTAPVLTVPAVDVVAEATSAAGAVVEYLVSATDAVDSAPTITCSQDSGTGFPLGTTEVSCSASDFTGNTSETQTFNVVVRDTTAPELTVPAVDVVAEATSAAGAVVEYLVSATDAVDSAPTITCSQDSGTGFPLGTTEVSCSASDFTGNTSETQTFNVVVRDTTAPVLTVPAVDVVAEATSAAGAVVEYLVSATDAVDSAPTITCSQDSGTGFPLGTTEVSCSASDFTGNTSETQTFNVVVRDTTAPELTVPADITTQATSKSGAVVTYSASATDLVDGIVTPACSPASGSTFVIGTTPVTCTATDAHGNKASKSFNVTVTSFFSGFYQPVDMGGVLNTVKNGSTVPLKFEVFGATGEIKLVSFVQQPLKAVKVACATGVVEDTIELTATGGTSLRFDTTGDQFIYNWQTPKVLGCYNVTVSLTDGSYMTANFKLK